MISCQRSKSTPLTWSRLRMPFYAHWVSRFLDFDGRPLRQRKHRSGAGRFGGTSARLRSSPWLGCALAADQRLAGAAAGAVARQIIARQNQAWLAEIARERIDLWTGLLEAADPPKMTTTYRSSVQVADLAALALRRMSQTGEERPFGTRNRRD